MSLYTNALLTPTRVATLENSSTKGIDYRTDFEKILEFHDELYVNDFNNRNLYYKALLESDEVLNEGVFTALSAIIAGIILTVTGIISFFFKGRNGDNENSVLSNRLEALRKGYLTSKQVAPRFIDAYKSNSLKVDRATAAKGNFGIFTNTFLDLNNIFSPEDNKAVNELVDLIKDFVSQFKQNLANGSGKFNDENYLDSLIEKIKSIKERIDDYDFIIEGKDYPFEWHIVEINASELFDLAHRVDFFSTSLKKYIGTEIDEIKNLKSIVSDLDELKKTMNSAANNGNNNNTINICNKFIPYAREVVIAYSKQIGSYASSYSASLLTQEVGITKAMRDMLGIKANGDPKEPEEEDTVGGEVAEQVQIEAAILDEQFSNSLAATFKDLKWSYMDAYRQGYVNEAVILAEDKDVDNKLIELNEAIGTKIKSAFNNAVMKIKELFAKFMEKLRANVASTKNYLDKYKKYILGTTINTDYTGKDIINGMYNVMNYVIPAFDYTTIKESLNNPQMFFERFLKPKDIRGKAPNVNIGNDDQSLSQIGEYFKQYFGCSGEDGPILATNLQNSIKDIYDFMYDISKIEKSINDSIRNVEGLRDRALRQAGVEEVAKESASYLGHTPVLLELTPQQSPQPASNNQGAPNNYTGKTASQMTNVASAQKDANGQEQYGVAQTAKEEVDAKCNVYIQTVTKVLQAKLTAVEFLRNEFMVVFRDLVQRNVEGNANPSGATVNNTSNMPGAQQPATAEQEPIPQEEQPTRNKREKRGFFKGRKKK